MKVLYIDGDYFLYPEDVKDFNSLKDYINKNYSSFVQLTKLSSDRTVPPFFIDEYSKQVYVNFSGCQSVEETDVTIMSKADYKTSLNNAIDEVCAACDSFIPGERRCDCGELQNNLCLNGTCEVFSLADDEFL